MKEVVLASSLCEGMTFAWDIETGTHLFTFQNNACMPRTLKAVNSVRDNCGTCEPEYLIAAQTDKSSINIWALGKDRPIYRCNLAEPMISLATSQDGTLAIGGGSSGSCYAWDVSTGELIRVWSAHYKAVSALCFSDCGSFLISGGEDSIVHFWKLYEIIDMEKCANAEENLNPMHTINSHSLAISQLCTIGGTGQVTCPLLSVALDGFAQIHDIPSGKCLYKVNTTIGLYSACVDPLMQKLYLGAADGNIFEVALHQAALQQSAELQMTSKFGGIYEALSNSGGQDNLKHIERDDKRLDSEQQGRYTMPVFLGLDSPVTDLSISSCGSYLLSASENGACCVWDTVSRQKLTTLQNPKASSTATKTSDKEEDVKNSKPLAMTSLLVLPKELVSQAPKKENERALLQPLRKFATPAQVTAARYSGEPNEGGTLDEVVSHKDKSIRLPVHCEHDFNAEDDSLMSSFHEDMLNHLEKPLGDTKEGVEVDADSNQKDEEIRSLKREVDTLKEENQRWKAVNEKLRALHEQR